VARQVVGDRADAGRDDRLVERGEEHAEQQPGQDGQDLPVRELLLGGAGYGWSGGHAVSKSARSSSSAVSNELLKRASSFASRSMSALLQPLSRPATMSSRPCRISATRSRPLSVRTRRL